MKFESRSGLKWFDCCNCAPDTRQCIVNNMTSPRQCIVDYAPDPVGVLLFSFVDPVRLQLTLEAELFTGRQVSRVRFARPAGGREHVGRTSLDIQDQFTGVFSCTNFHLYLSVSCRSNRDKKWVEKVVQEQMAISVSK